MSEWTELPNRAGFFIDAGDGITVVVQRGAPDNSQWEVRATKHVKPEGFTVAISLDYDFEDEETPLEDVLNSSISVSRAAILNTLAKYRGED